MFPRWMLWPLFAAVMGFAVGGSVAWSIDQPKQQQHQNHADARAATSADKHQPTKTWGESLSIIWNRTWDDPVAFYTFVLSIFTAVLAIISAFQIGFLFSTDKTARITARAAESNAKTAELALLSVEIPYLYPSISSHGIDTANGVIRGFQFPIIVTYHFKNFGRTPTEIIEVFGEIAISGALPPPVPIPVRALNPQSGTVVPSNGRSEDFENYLNEGMLQRFISGGFKPHQHYVWFHGYVRYNDVFDNEYVRGFCLAFSPTTGQFYPLGGNGYNYRKKTKAADQMITESAPQPPA